MAPSPREGQRLEALRRYAVLDTPDEALFDRVTELVAKLFDVPIALITLVDEDRQWFKSRSGTSARETSRALAFCDYAIRQEGALVVNDTLLDPRFKTSDLVTGGPHIRFYAGAPLIANDGSKIGTVCVLDREPRELDRTQRELLERISEIVMAQLDLRLETIQLKAAQNELAAVIDAAQSAIIIGRVDGTITGWNAAATSIFGWTRDEVLGRRRSLVPFEFEAQAQEIRHRIIDRGEIIKAMRVHGLHKNGSVLELSMSAKPIVDASGNPTAGAYVVEDEAETTRTRRIERRRFQVLELIASDSPLEIVAARLVENLELSVPGSAAMLSRLRGNRLYHVASGEGISRTYVAKYDGFEIGPNERTCGAAAALGETIVSADIAHDPRWKKYRKAPLAEGLRSCWSVPIRNGRGAVLGTFALFARTIREPTVAELRSMHEAAHIASIAMEADDSRRHLESMALHDALTGLPNRNGFEQHMQSAIESANLRGKRVGFGVLDLNRFKIVNDSLGRAMGDNLLREIATRLDRAMRPGDMLARMGGDEFFFCLCEVDDREAVERIVRHLSATLDQSFLPEGHEVFVRATFGITMFPDDSREPSQLLRLADTAMHAAKRRGEAIGFCDEAERADGINRVALEAQLNYALTNGEFELYYQPQVDVLTGAVIGAEALIRWNHPKLGLTMPDTFVRIAEETGLIVPIGAWVVRDACRFAKRWLDEGGPGIVSVNVSPRQFEANDFVDTVVAALEVSGLPAGNLWLEITESLIMRSPETAAVMIADLRALGVRSSIDDFGTGYSNLNNLRRFPVDGLKIDQTFLRDIGGPLRAGNDVALMRAIISVGSAMQLSIVAEGVENQAQLDFLAKHQCQAAQGYHFARPMPAAQLLKWRGASL